MARRSSAASRVRQSTAGVSDALGPAHQPGRDRPGLLAVPEAVRGDQPAQQVRLPAGQPGGRTLARPGPGQAGWPVTWPRAAVRSAAAVDLPFGASAGARLEILFRQAARLGTQMLWQHRVAGQFQACGHQVVVDLRVGCAGPRTGVLGAQAQGPGPVRVCAQQVADVMDQHAAQLRRRPAGRDLRVGVHPPVLVYGHRFAARRGDRPACRRCRWPGRGTGRPPTTAPRPAPGRGR